MNRPVAISLAVAALAGAYALGRVSAPARVETVERVVTREVQAVQVQHTEQREAARVETRVVYRDRVVTPDGTVREREVERSESAAVQREQSATVEQTVRTVDVERVASRTVTVPAPDWRVGVLVGVPVRLAPGPVLVGVLIQRRLWGPVSAGAWTLAPVGPGAPVAAGVSLSVEF